MTFEEIYATKWHRVFPRNDPLKHPRAAIEDEAAKAGGRARAIMTSVKAEMMALDLSEWRFTSGIAAELGLKVDTCRNRMRALKVEDLVQSRYVKQTANGETLQWKWPE